MQGKRRRLRIVSLIVVTSFTLLVGIWRFAQYQRARSVAAITSAGGSVVFEHQIEPQNPIQRSYSPTLPEPLRWLLGEHAFERISEVHVSVGGSSALPNVLIGLGDAHTVRLNNRSVDADWLKLLSQMKQVRTLSFNLDEPIENADLQQIDLRHIVDLEISGNGVTDALMERITSSGNLSHVVVLNGRLSSTGLRSLSQCPLRHLRMNPAPSGCIRALRDAETLESLELIRAQAMELRLLTQLPKLRSLHLFRCELTDRDLEDIGQCGKLEQLSVGHSPLISDRSIDCLVALQQLQVLDLTGTSIGDVTVKQLPRLRQLREVYLDETQVSDVGITALSKCRMLTYAFVGSRISDHLAKTLSEQRRCIVIHNSQTGQHRYSP